MNSVVVQQSIIVVTHSVFRHHDFGVRVSVLHPAEELSKTPRNHLKEIHRVNYKNLITRSFAGYNN